MPAIRAFVAIPLGQDVKDALTAVQRELRGRDARGAARWTQPDSIHLTLKFLGDVDTARIADISGALDTVCERHEAFALQIQGVGCFPNLRRPRVVWVGLSESLTALALLQRDIEGALEKLDFPRESRPFSPHLTIARIQRNASPSAAESLGRVIGETEVPVISRMRVDHIVLMQSQLRPSGAIYTERHRALLGQRPAKLSDRDRP